MPRDYSHGLLRQMLCPTSVCNKSTQRPGGNLTEIHPQAGSVTITQYDISAALSEALIAEL